MACLDVRQCQELGQPNRLSLCYMSVVAKTSNVRIALTRCVELDARLELVECVSIEHADLDNLGTREGCAVSVKRAATVAAEVARDRVATVCFLADALW